MHGFGSFVSLEPSEPVLFLSDLHFGDGGGTDLFAGQDGDLIAFLDHHRDRVGTIVFLGDILDMPQAWSTRRIRSAHGDLWSYICELVRAKPVIFVRGNHDWSVDYETLFAGSTRSEAVLIGERTLAWHGHQVDLEMNPGVRTATFKTYVHALLERAAGTRLIPPLERYDSPANRLAITAAIGFGRLNAAMARALRSVGRAEQAEAIEARVRYLARSFIGDPADIFGVTDRTVLGRDFDTVLCGHTHVPGVITTPRGTYANTGTWTSGQRTYARWTGDRFQVMNEHTKSEIGDQEFANLPAETQHTDLFRWWSEHHRGFLRFEL